MIHSNSEKYSLPSLSLLKLHAVTWTCWFGAHEICCTHWIHTGKSDLTLYLRRVVAYRLKEETHEAVIDRNSIHSMTSRLLATFPWFIKRWIWYLKEWLKSKLSSVFSQQTKKGSIPDTHTNMTWERIWECFSCLNELSGSRIMHLLQKERRMEGIERRLHASHTIISKLGHRETMAYSASRHNVEALFSSWSPFACGEGRWELRVLIISIRMQEIGRKMTNISG